MTTKLRARRGDRQHQTIGGVEHWECTKCHTLKPVGHFSSHDGNRPHSRCRSCVNRSQVIDRARKAQIRKGSAPPPPADAESVYLETIERVHEVGAGLGLSRRGSMLAAFELWLGFVSKTSDRSSGAPHVAGQDRRALATPGL